MEMNTKMILENCYRNDNDLIIQPDRIGDDILITFSITVDGDRMLLSEKELDPEDGGETYFYINKAQTKVLIRYLQSLVDDM